MHKNYGALYLSTLLLLALACGTPPKDTASRPPNILWIIAEDLSPDLACYGHPGVYTPNIDQLARDGMRFTQVFTTGPACTPSRTALGVGMYQNSINAHHMRYPDELRNPLPADVVPINELFRRKGYQTANIKDELGTGKSDWSFTSPVAAYDTQHWDSLSQNKPFFAVVNLRLTHRPFEKDTLHPVDRSTVIIPPYYPDHPVSREDFAQYLESMQIMDRQVGAILGKLEKRGFRENTIVVFFSDHGRPMSRAKNHLYDSGIQIPLVIQAPTGLSWREYLPAGSVNEQLISAIDISATSLAFAGIAHPRWMQGKVFLGTQQDPEHSAIFSAGDRLGESFFKSRAVRSKKWKYIRNYRHDFSINEMATAYRKANHPIYHLLNIYKEKGLLTPTQQALVEPLPGEELYDLRTDPYEINNLVNDPAHTAQLEQMRAELASWQTDIHDYGMEADSKALEAAFEEYGQKSRENYQKKIEQLEKAVRDEVEQ